MARISTHVIETKSKDCVRSRIDGFGDRGDYIYRELSERDYGIDAIIECFEDGIPTGKIGFLQIKGTNKEITPLQNTPVVSCYGVSTSNLYYAKQNRIPVILIYVSLKGECPMYYADLRDITQDMEFKKESERVIVHIPQDNITFNNISPILDIINRYYI